MKSMTSRSESESSKLKERTSFTRCKASGVRWVCLIIKGSLGADLPCACSKLGPADPGAAGADPRAPGHVERQGCTTVQPEAKIGCIGRSWMGVRG
eukprot:767048-Hanusia_phi.AAC.10